MDEQSREDSIRRQLGKRIAKFRLDDADTRKLKRRLQNSLNILPRREKGRILRDIDRERLSRRDFLKLLGFGVGGAALASAGSHYYMDRASRYLDTVTGYQAAGDYNVPGDEPIDRSAMTERELDISDGEDLYEYVASGDPGELLVVPPGEYEWSSSFRPGQSNFGVRGEGDLDVTINVPAGVGHGTEWNLFGPTEDNYLFENFVIDSDGTACPHAQNTRSGDGLFHRLRYLTKEGEDRDHSHAGKTFSAHTSGGSHLMLDTITYHNRGSIGYRSHGFMFASSEGDLTVRNCKITGFSDNGVYTRMTGAMLVENCVFANNTPSDIRIGGDNEEVRNCTFYMDTGRANELYDLDGGRGPVNTAGVVADQAERASDGGYVENCSFIIEETPNAAGAFRWLNNNDWLEISNCQVMLNDSGVPGIGATGGRAREVTLEEVVFVTENSSGAIAARNIADTFTTSNVCVSDGIDAGALNPDSTDCSFDGDDAHAFPEDDDFSFVDEAGKVGQAVGDDNGNGNGLNLDPC